MRIPFLKMHGAANDFVVIDRRAPDAPPVPADLVRRLCDRRRGVGADGVLLLERDPQHDFAMRYFNADGGEADFCGNGARAIARAALDLGLGAGAEVRFRTAAGAMKARATADGRIALGFGRVAAPGEAVTVEALGRVFTGRLLRAGVPHLVVPVERVEAVPLPEWGAALRRHPRFAPEGANVDFVAKLAPARVAMRTYERGVEGETLACGSGAMATGVWATLEGERPPITVVTAGGDELVIGLEPAADGYETTLTGPAETAFRGDWTEAPAAAGAGSR